MVLLWALILFWTGGVVIQKSIVMQIMQIVTCLQCLSLSRYLFYLQLKAFPKQSDISTRKSKKCSFSCTAAIFLHTTVWHWLLDLRCCLIFSTIFKNVYLLCKKKAHDYYSNTKFKFPNVLMFNCQLQSGLKKICNVQYWETNCNIKIHHNVDNTKQTHGTKLALSPIHIMYHVLTHSKLWD